MSDQSNQTKGIVLVRSIPHGIHVSIYRPDELDKAIKQVRTMQDRLVTVGNRHALEYLPPEKILDIFRDERGRPRGGKTVEEILAESA